jgi:hypothetical protein
MTLAQLREHGVPQSVVAERCRPGGPWRQLFPQVFLLHAGPPTSEERLRAALLYAQRPDSDVMITGLAALALHGFPSVPSLLGLDRIDILVPRQRRLRDCGEVAILRARSLPRPERVTGLPCAPVPRALADAVAGLDDPDTVGRLLLEAVRGGHCDAASVVRALREAELLDRPHVVAAVDALLAEGRAAAEGRLYDLVRDHDLPDPLWNVDLWQRGGPRLGHVDAYWPEHGIAVVIDARTAGERRLRDDAEAWAAHVRRRESLERLGVTTVHITPRGLRDTPVRQAAVVGTALAAAHDLDHGCDRPRDHGSSHGSAHGHGHGSAHGHGHGSAHGHGHGAAPGRGPAGQVVAVPADFRPCW